MILRVKYHILESLKRVEYFCRILWENEGYDYEDKISHFGEFKKGWVVFVESYGIMRVEHHIQQYIFLYFIDIVIVNLEFKSLAGY